MKKLLFFAVIAGFLAFTLRPQLESFDLKGERRFEALSRPSKEIVVGVCWPFSTNQDGMANGLQLALDEVNSGGLAGGHTLRLVLRDDEFDWKKAKNIAVEFANTPDMSAVIGYYNDAPAVRASAIFESGRLLNIIIGANNTAMTAHGFEYVVRTVLPSNKIARTLAKLTTDRGYKKIAVIWEEDAYGEDLAYQYSVGLDNLDTQVVYQASYSRNRPDFRLMVNELKAVDADLIFFAGLEPWAGDFLSNARRVGLTTAIVGAFSDTPEMRKRAGQAMEGAMFFDYYNDRSSSIENQTFVHKFHARYGNNPDTWAAQGYDALHILAKAIKFTGSRNPLDLSYAIRYMDAWEGVNGRYKFDNQGELDDKPLFVKVIQGGIPVLLQTSALSALPAH